MILVTMIIPLYLVSHTSPSLQPVMVLRISSLMVSFVPADWRLRVFESSGGTDRMSDHIYIRTNPLYGFMKRRSCYVPFYSQALLACHRKTCALAASLEWLPPYSSPRWGTSGI